MNLTNIEIFGLFGKYNLSVPVHDNTLIIVSPNGAGKSTVISIVYLFITRQWKRLKDLDFEAVALTINGERLEVTKSDIEYWLSVANRSVRSFAGYIERLRDQNLFEEFIKLPRLSTEQRVKFSNVLRMPPSQVSHFHRDIRAEIDPDLFQANITATEKLLSDAQKGQVLFLPTYRRIEKDLQAIFPSFEEGVRRYVSAESLSE